MLKRQWILTWSWLRLSSQAAAAWPRLCRSGAAVQALPAERTQLELRWIQPASVLGGVVELQTLEDSQSLVRRISIVQAGPLVGVEIVHHYPNALCVGVVHVYELFHLGREVQLGPLLGHIHVAPTNQPLHRHE